MKNLLSQLLILLLFITSTTFAETSSFLIISDIHLDESSTHQMEINPKSQTKDNDLDNKTFNALLATLSKQVKKLNPDFIIILGDIVGHIRLEPTSAVKSESEVFKKIHQTFPTTPTFFVFGNNDSLDDNYGPFFSKNLGQSPYTIAEQNGWLNGFLSNGQKCGKNQFPCLDENNPLIGHYTAYLKPNLKLIALNSNLFSPRNTEQAGTTELTWLQNQLEKASQEKASVIIAMHIPAGLNVYDNTNFWMPDLNNQFLRLVNQYQSIIISILSSHTHMEEMKIIKDRNKKIIAPILFTAGLSTSHGNSPSVKLFTFTQENQKWNFENYETYRFSNQDSIEKLYDFTHYYCEKPTDSFKTCLRQVNAQKIVKYFSIGNPNFPGVIIFPENIFLPMGPR